MALGSTDIVILCGGLGTRLKDEIGDMPKVMAEVNGKPFLDFHVQWLKKQGAERIILSTGYKAEVIEDYYRKKDFGIIIDYSRETEQLGTGGALRNASGLIKSRTFLVLNGDSFCPVNLYALNSYLSEKKALTVMVATSAMKGDDYGRLAVDDEDRVIEFREKGQYADKTYVNAGVYAFDKRVFDEVVPEKRSSLEHDWFPQLIGKGFYAFTLESRFFDIGTPERYRATKKLFQEG